MGELEQLRAELEQARAALAHFEAQREHKRQTSASWWKNHPDITRTYAERRRREKREQYNAYHLAYYHAHKKATQ